MYVSMNKEKDSFGLITFLAGSGSRPHIFSLTSILVGSRVEVPPMST